MRERRAPWKYFEAAKVFIEGMLVGAATERMRIAGEEFWALSEDLKSYKGSHQYIYEGINATYEKYVNAHFELLTAIDFCNHVIGPLDLISQLKDVALGTVSEFTNIPVDTLLSIPGLADAITSSLIKYAELYNSFYDPIDKIKEESLLIKQKILDTGYINVVVPRVFNNLSSRVSKKNDWLYNNIRLQLVNHPVDRSFSNLFRNIIFIFGIKFMGGVIPQIFHNFM